MTAGNGGKPWLILADELKLFFDKRGAPLPGKLAGIRARQGASGMFPLR